MEDPNRTYRTLHFLVRHGNWLATVIAAGTLLLAGVVWVFNGSVWAVPICIFAAAFLYVMLRSYVELVRHPDQAALPPNCREMFAAAFTTNLMNSFSFDWILTVGPPTVMQ